MHKTIGRKEWIGARRGGIGVFIKYCPECHGKIYFEGEDEYEKFLEITGVKRSNWLKKIKLPHLKIEWGLTDPRR